MITHPRPAKQHVTETQSRPEKTRFMRTNPMIGRHSSRPDSICAPSHPYYGEASPKPVYRNTGMEPWKTTQSKYLLQAPWLSLRADTCETAEGLIIDPYYVLECPEWVHIIPFDAQNRILVTRQYRHGNGQITLEVPCGQIDPGETPLEAAKRELLEETGCTAQNYEAIGAYYANPARQNNRLHCFIAIEAEETQAPQFDQDEYIEHEFITPEELLGLIDTGEFVQAYHVAAVLQAFRKRGLLNP